MEVVPWLNVLAVGFLLSLLQSSYIYAPGLSIALDPKDSGAGTRSPGALDLPTATASKLPGRLVDATLSMQSSNAKIEDKMFRLEHGIYHYADLPAALQVLAAKIKKHPGDQPVLLLVAPADTTNDIDEKLYEMASAAGFSIVQLAAMPARNPEDQSGNLPAASGVSTP
jgi:hypothetical protein